MRYPVAYYMLLLYATVMLKPLMPLISDAWDHTFAESIHIATVHAKYGANHVEKAMAEAGAENAAKHPNTVKSTEVVPVHFKHEPALPHWPVTLAGVEHNYYQPNNMPAVSIAGHYPPPKFSC